MTDSVGDLQKQVDEYIAEQKKIEVLLERDPRNKDLQQYAEQAKQLVDMTKDVLLLKKQEEQEKMAPPPPPDTPIEIPITKDQEKPKMSYAVGLVCRAKWTQDKKWYDAVIESVDKEHAKYTVLFREYGNRDVISEDCIQPPPPPELKKKQNLEILSIPESLRTTPEDTEEEKLAKKKRIHSIKSKNRFKQMDAMTNSKQNSWQSFMKSTTSQKRGLPLKKQSMFRTPDTVEGKVGVVGSGKGMTSYDDTRKVDSRRTKVTLSLDKPRQ